MFLLRPDKELTDAVEYLLAHYSGVYEIELYAACMMSTHLHLVYRDVRGEGPNFLRDLHRGIALVVQSLRNWTGAVFAQRPCQVRVLTEEALIDKIAYTLANPVSQHGVAAPEMWPGLWSSVLATTEALETLRPSCAFSPHGRLPATAALRFVLPEVLVTKFGRASALRKLRSACEEHSRLNRAQVLKQGGRFLKPAECRSVNPRTQSTARELNRAVTPQFSTLGSGRAGFARAVHELREFRRAYRQALERFRMGFRDVVFPVGTFQLRSVLALSCSTA